MKISPFHPQILSRSRNLLSHFRPKEFDACVALDVIEHFSKSDGLKLLESLESIAKRKVVIFTPNGFLPQSSTVAGDYQEHLSGWEPEEMKRRGYHVTGLDGYKFFRTTHHRLRFRPAFFWALVSWLSHHVWCRTHAKSAAAILCIKELELRPALAKSKKVLS